MNKKKQQKHQNTEKEPCSFRADFNINLVNFEDCQMTEEFINTIVYNMISYHILCSLQELLIAQQL